MPIELQSTLTELELSSILQVSTSYLKAVRDERLIEGEDWIRARYNKVEYTPSGVTKIKIAFGERIEIKDKEPVEVTVKGFVKNPHLIMVADESGELHKVRVANKWFYRPGTKIKVLRTPGSDILYPA